MSESRGNKVLAVASGGGHWVQLRRLAPAFEGREVVWVTTHAGYANEVGPERLRVVRDASAWSKLSLALCALQVAWIVVRERPGCVVSTGAAPGLLALACGRLVGARTMWIDSIANASELSRCGRAARRFADVRLTQWPELACKGGAEYAGAVL